MSEDVSKVLEFGKILYQAVETCPVCGARSLSVYEVLYEVPNFSNMILTSSVCTTCGFRHVDLQYLEDRGHVRVEYRIEDKVDVERTLLIRSSTCSISSPELGFSLTPGACSEAMITTVEGLLYKIRGYAESMMVLYEENAERIREFTSRVDRALRGQISFTLILDDPSGCSAIIPPPGRENKLVVSRTSSNMTSEV